MLLSIGVAGLLMTLATACGGSPASPDTAQPAGAPSQDIAPEQVAKRLKVAVVTRVEGPSGLNALAAKGLQDAIIQLRVKGRVVEPKSSSDYLRTLTGLAKSGYDFVISIGPEAAAPTWQAAKEYPDSMFAIVDYTYGVRRSLPNLESLAFDHRQAGYLAGYLAGMMTKTRTVSSIGARRTPSVEGYIAGFAKGARDARPGTKTLVGFSNDVAHGAVCRRIALRQIAAGSDIVFPVAGVCGRGALDAVRQKGVWGIGLDTDMSYLGPYILTSAIKRYDAVVFDAIQGAANGAVEDAFGTMSPYGFHGGGVTVYGVNYHGVGLGRASPQVPPRYLARVEALRRRLTGGAIQIPDTAHR
jgi:basic membrane protein A